MKKQIYMDNVATTKVRKEVVSEMQKYMLEDYGNPSSQHELGQRARNAIDKARTEIAKEIGAKPGEIYFTSGGTESNNLAIIGLAKANPGKKTIIISSIELIMIVFFPGLAFANPIIARLLLSVPPEVK